jgi:hypothetical protein
MNLLRRLLDVWPLGPGGMLVLGLSAVGLVRYGVGHRDLVLLVVAGVGLVVAAIALVAVVGTAVVTWAALRGGGDGAAGALEREAGVAARTGFTVHHPWFVPFVAVDWTWESPEVEVVVERDGRWLHERVTPRRRGDHEGIVRRVVVADLFGISNVAFRVRERRRARFVPGTGRLEQMQVVQGMAGGDALSHPDGPPAGDRLDMRRYGDGDPIRFVLWKVFARTRQLVIRNPENALSPVSQTVAYLVAGRGDEAAAGAARVAVRCGALGGDWTFGADGHGEPATTAAGAMELIVRSGHVAPGAGGEGLARFLAGTGSGTTRRAVVFVPGTPGPWIDRVLAATRASGRGGTLDFMVCADDLDRTPVDGPVKRLLLVGAPADAEVRATAAGLRAVVAALGGGGARVMLVDRAGGRVLPATALRGRSAG